MIDDKPINNTLKTLVLLKQEYKNLEEKDIKKIAYIYGKQMAKYFITYCFISENLTIEGRRALLKAKLHKCDYLACGEIYPWPNRVGKGNLIYVTLCLNSNTSVKSKN